MNKGISSNSNFNIERTTFGKICKYSWIGFNILFFLWVIYFVLRVIYGFLNGSYISSGEVDSTLGIGLAISLICFVVVFVGGNVVLGLMTFFTRPNSIKKPINDFTLFLELFNFNEKLKREVYCKNIILGLFTFFIFRGILFLVGYYLLQEIITTLLFFMLILFICSQNSKRCHDLEKSGWWQFVPFYILWLFFKK